jgi:phosphatidylglycerophosphatase A
MMASTTRAFQISDWWSFGMGTGFMWPSGTVGSVLGIGLVAIAHQLGSQTCLLMMTIGVTGLSWWACIKTCRKLDHDDHPCIVSDEVVGMMWTMIAVPLTIKSAWIGFVLFRLFDIIKPWPISFFDRAHRWGAHAVMLDDVIAALMANLTIQIFYLSML